jgi:hypothetical protein
MELRKRRYKEDESREFSIKDGCFNSVIFTAFTLFVKSLLQK